MSFRVLHIDTERTWRGGEQQMAYLCQGMARLGHEPHVVCRPNSPCEAKMAALGVPVHPLAIHADLGVIAAWRLARLADRIGAQILHAHTSRAHLPAVMAARLARSRPRCVVHRRVDFSVHKLPLRLSGLKYRFGVDRYIAITEAVKAIMAADGIPTANIRVVHSSVDLSRFEGVARKPGLRQELGVPEDCRLVGTVGFLVGHKAHEYLLDAAPKVLARFPDAFFLILGEGELRPNLEAQARRLGIESRLRMPGERRDIAQCLAEFDLFVMPSSGEGLGTAVLEAMAMRRPIVATTAGGLAEVMQDGVNGLTVPPRDSEALAAAICRMLTEPALADRLAQGGRTTVEQEFSSEKMVARTLAVYEELLG